MSQQYDPATVAELEQHAATFADELEHGDPIEIATRISLQFARSIGDATQAFGVDVAQQMQLGALVGSYGADERARFLEDCERAWGEYNTRRAEGVAGLVFQRSNEDAH